GKFVVFGELVYQYLLRGLTDCDVDYGIAFGSGVTVFDDDRQGFRIGTFDYYPCSTGFCRPVAGRCLDRNGERLVALSEEGASCLTQVYVVERVLLIVRRTSREKNNRQYRRRDTGG